MSFSFGFDGGPTPAPSEPVSEATPSAPPAAEHQPTEARWEAEQWPIEEVVVEAGAVRHTLRKPVQPEALLPELIGDGEKVSDLDSSDLVKGVYEGGFKLWECARDMMQVLEELRLQGALTVRAPAATLGSGCNPRLRLEGLLRGNRCQSDAFLRRCPNPNPNPDPDPEPNPNPDPNPNPN